MACLLLGGCSSSGESAPSIVSDLVCGAVVNPAKAIKVLWAGRVYYFDSPECQAEFLSHAPSITGQHARHQAR
jgi:YHS domain-containing protein